jgi:hypothetical protein
LVDQFQLPADPNSIPAVQDPPAKPSTDERLDRLEGMFSQLLAEMQKQPKAQTGFGTKQPAPTTVKELPLIESFRSLKEKPPMQAAPERVYYRGSPIATPSDVEAKLVELEFEIKSLELQLQRAKAHREGLQMLQKQLKESPDGRTGGGVPAPPSAGGGAPGGGGGVPAPPSAGGGAAPGAAPPRR